MNSHNKIPSKRFCVWGAIMSAGFLSLLITMFFSHGQSLLDLTYCRPTDTYYDFTISISAAENRYNYRGNYPPLIQLFFFTLAWMLPDQYKGLTIRELIATPLGAMYVMFFFVAVTVWIAWLLEDNLREPKWAKRMCMFLLFFSVPYIYGLQRGNVLFICLPFILLYIFHYDSESSFKRIMALVSLAVAAGIKLYPALLGMLLIKERRWKQAGICIVFGLASVLLPAMFYDGVDTLLLVVQRIFSISSVFDDRGVGHQVGLVNAVEMLNQALNINLNEKICFYFMVVFMVVIFFLAKRRWQLVTILCVAMVTWPSFSFVYTLIYMIVPLLDFLNSDEKFTWLDVVYCILFASCFVIIPFGGQNAFTFTEGQYYDLNISTVVENIGINLLVITIGVQVIVESVLDRLRKKNSSN